MHGMHGIGMWRPLPPDVLKVPRPFPRQHYELRDRRARCVEEGRRGLWGEVKQPRPTDTARGRLGRRIGMAVLQ